MGGPQPLASSDDIKSSTRSDNIVATPASCSTFADDLSWESQSATGEKARENCGERFVFTQDHVLVMAWSVILLFLLIYVGTVFLFRFAFLTFHIDETGTEIDPLEEGNVAWNTVDACVDALFWFDLVINFFLSYEDADGHEVTDMWVIAQHYLMGGFWLNLVACLPTSVAREIIDVVFNLQGGSSSADLGVTRAYRLQRISRLARLARLARIAKLASISNRFRNLDWFQSLRGVRVVNFLLGLIFTCHLMACGWYLTAALHDNPGVTWVARREFGENKTLLHQSPIEQWLTSMYFILTVFSTVGFGDMSAVTEAEIVYVVLTMVVGAVVHSIVISEVIQIITTTDRLGEWCQKQAQLLEDFSDHVDLHPNARNSVMANLKERSRQSMAAEHMHSSKDEVKRLILSNVLPRSIIGQLPDALYCGRLCRNVFISAHVSMMPPRLPSLMAIHLVSREFLSGEVIFQLHDYAFYLGLVIQGNFACVGKPGQRGGKDAMPFHAVAAALHSEPQHSLSKHSRQSCSQVASASHQLRSEEGASSHLFPYRLFGPNSYFGDMECLTSSMRKATVRCELSGTVLILKKPDLFELIQEFPQFGEMWASAAWRRERFRKSLLKQLKAPLSYQNFSAVTIQRFVRARRVSRRAGVAEGVAPKATYRSQVKRMGLDQVLEGSSSFDFSQKDLKQIACSAHSQTLMIRNVDKLKLGLDKMRGEVRSGFESAHADIQGIKSDIQGIKEALKELLPADHSNRFKEPLPADNS